ncbi:RNA methyltransferase [candidate division KSB1 bacterium]|nr:RNA methyltransferase [candidate division KSB1 bacterium]
MIPLSQNQYKYIRSLQFKKGRDRENRFLVEGIRLCEEAINSDYQINSLIIAENLRESERILQYVDKIKKQQLPIYITDEKKFKTLADTQTPQGIACIVTKKERPIDLSSSSLLLALDAIRDPGNLGTIIRTAEWFGIDGIFSGVDTVDIYNPKVIRSTMGAFFHVPVKENVILPDELNVLKKNNYKIIGTVREGGIPLEQFKKKEKTVLLIGSEAQGLNPGLKKIIDMNITISGKGKSESLNAAIAAGITLYHFTKDY